MPNLTIASTHIRTDAQGRFCLNDLHRAAGGENRHRPSLWTENQQTKALIAELGTEAGIPALASQHGGAAAGTYVSKELVYAYAMWISPGFHLKVIRAYDALVTQPLLPQSLPEALRLAADLAEQKALAEQQRDDAIATKALIGSKREATAMATAAAAKRKAHKLEVELDRSKLYSTVKRVERDHPGARFNWRLLKRTSEEIGIPAIDVFDQNYGSVKSYHADVWRKAYSIEIDRTETEGRAAQ